MKAMMVCGLLSLIGLFACVESPEPESEPVSEVEISSDVDEGADEVLLLPPPGCTTWTCPTTGFNRTGCTPLAVKNAFLACEAVCSVGCDASDSQ